MTGSKKIQCPCMLVAAPSSGSGKTTITAAIARWHVRQGRTVKIFKAGPDFIDPMILQQACGAAVYSLDLGMMSESHCQQLLYRAAKDADLILIEGVMGLFDGQYSAALIAKTFNIPIALIVDVRAMAETFGAIAHGLACADRDLTIIGALANRVASERHADMAQDGLNSLASDSISWLGAMPFDKAVTFPERHLGLVQAREIQDLMDKLDSAANLLKDQKITDLPPDVDFFPANDVAIANGQLKGKTVAVAYDNAFSFVYAANIDFLKEQGADVVYVSPLADKALPDCDAFYIPGGYPELYAQELSANHTFLDSVRSYSGTIIAECGGMIFLSESLVDLSGNHFSFCGRLPIHTRMHDKLQAIGWQKLITPDGQFLAHTFHYSSSELKSEIPAETAETRFGKIGEAVYRVDNITASYLHWYFSSNPKAAVKLFSC